MTKTVAPARSRLTTAKAVGIAAVAVAAAIVVTNLHPGSPQTGSPPRPTAQADAAPLTVRRPAATTRASARTSASKPPAEVINLAVVLPTSGNVTITLSGTAWKAWSRFNPTVGTFNFHEGATTNRYLYDPTREGELNVRATNNAPGQEARCWFFRTQHPDLPIHPRSSPRSPLTCNYSVQRDALLGR